MQSPSSKLGLIEEASTELTLREIFLLLVLFGFAFHPFPELRLGLLAVFRLALPLLEDVLHTEAGRIFVQRGQALLNDRVAL